MKFYKILSKILLLLMLMKNTSSINGMLVFFLHLSPRHLLCYNSSNFAIILHLLITRLLLLLRYIISKLKTFIFLLDFKLFSYFISFLSSHTSSTWHCHNSILMLFDFSFFYFQRKAKLFIHYFFDYNLLATTLINMLMICVIHG